jgi:magnesium chelatase family protein
MCSDGERAMTVASIWGFALLGVDAVPVRVEAHVRNGLPGVTIVGLPGAAVREARERIRSGAASSGLPLPTRRITINLSPGDVPKDGPGFDLPVALATLAACGHLPADCVRDLGAVGEVSLDGLVRPTRGTLSVAEAAGKAGVALLIVPIEALPAATEAGAMPVAGVRSLAEAVLVARDSHWRARLLARGARWLAVRARAPEVHAPAPDLADVVGNHLAKRALEIVAAGGHHLLMVGPPGGGKTMLARRLTGILPPLSREEAVDVSRVWSAAGLQNPGSGVAVERPFRAPHHTASRTALVGGGGLLRPGEVSLSHRGVLFMDELPEFSRDCLESLRQPLEEGRVVISRRSGTAELPAAFTLIAAMNPCPCGYLGHSDKPCRCPAGTVEHYRSRISGPLLDRIDALVEVPALTLSALEEQRRGESSAAVRQRVASAAAFRSERTLRSGTVVGGRSHQAGDDLELQSLLDGDARRLVRLALVRECLSGRAYVRTISLARTIADLDGSVRVKADHLAEALALRLDYRRAGFG